jgi:hypothetical protein
VKKAFAVAFVGLGLLCSVWWFHVSRPLLRQKSKTQPRAIAHPPTSANRSVAIAQSTSSAIARRREATQKVLGALRTPIVFYGKVIDQNGDPVSNADVHYSTIDRFDTDGSKYTGRSDSQGNFSISGIRGAVLTVGVGKSGYYHVHGRSNGAFAYGVGSDATRQSPPTKDNPAVFMLQKMGTTEPLLYLNSRQVDVPLTGEPLLFDLTTGRCGTGNLQFEFWIGETNQRPFNWRYRLTALGGGIATRKGQFDFEAPAAGYEESTELDMPASSQNWSSSLTKDYFAKLPNGRYARFSVTFYPGKRNFFVIEAYVNPTPGDRNLEFDPAKQIKVK